MEIKKFVKEYEDKYPKAVASPLRGRERTLTFFNSPVAHWQSIRSTNVIESAFATVRLRQRVTKGAGSRTKGLTMAFKLLAMARETLAEDRQHAARYAAARRHEVR